MTDSKRTITIYEFRFEGLFGRNRKAKRYFGKFVEGPDQLGDEELQGILGNGIEQIGAKQGTATVYRTPNVEESTYAATVNGQPLVIHSIPLMTGATVAIRKVGT